ncbi:MAG: hypothetical protein ABIK28_08540 [Planctomycetota bacterium]
MTRNGAYPAFITAMISIFLFTGCAVFSSGPEIAAPSNDELSDDLLLAPQNDTPFEESLFQPNANAAGVAQDDQEEELTEERIQVLVGNFIEEGRSYMDQGLPQKAQEQFAHALELQPDNEEARNLFNQVTSTVENAASMDKTASLTDEISNRTVVRRTQNRMKAVELKKAGEVAMSTEEYSKAVKCFEDALLIVRWNPYLDEGNLDEGSLAGLLENAKNALKRQENDRASELQERIYQQQAEQETAEKERIATRISKLFSDANNAFVNDRFKESELYLNELLKLDPTNKMALELKTLTIDMRHSAKQEELRKNYKKQWRTTFDDLEYDDLPQVDLLQFPSDDEWERISMRGRTALSWDEEDKAPENKAIFDKLIATPIAANFEQASLQEVVDYLKATTGINILISPVIIESGEEPSFDLVTPPRPALDQLELLLSLALPPLKYKVQNGVVTILSAEEPLGEYILDVYDIRDLSKTVANFPAKEFNLTPSDNPEDFADNEEELAPDVMASEELIQLIQDNIVPSSWDNAENTINAIGNFLVVRQSRTVHDKINQLLNDLRASAGILVNVETRFIMVADNFLEDIGVDFRGLDGNINDDANPLAVVPNVLLDDFGDGSISGGYGYGSESDPSGIGTGNDAGVYYDDGGDGDLMGRLENLLDIQLGEDDILDNSGGTTVQFTFLDDVKLEAILRAVSKSSTSNIIQAPSLSIYNGERANITVMKNISYVKDFEPEIAQSSVIAEPIVAVAKDGIILDVRPVVSSDRRFITMELRPTIAQLKTDEKGQLPRFTTGLGVGESVTIELPELEVKRLRTTVTMPDGATLLLGGMKVSVEQKFDSGLPFLMHIPIISFFVSRKSQYESKRKLLILVTANIVIPEESEPKVGISK